MDFPQGAKYIAKVRWSGCCALMKETRFKHFICLGSENGILTKADVFFELVRANEERPIFRRTLCQHPDTLDRRSSAPWRDSLDVAPWRKINYTLFTWETRSPSRAISFSSLRMRRARIFRWRKRGNHHIERGSSALVGLFTQEVLLEHHVGAVPERSRKEEI